MNVMFIYGPPGVGKLTVAKELAALTGYRLMHNHLTVDLGLAIYDFGTPEFTAYVKSLRMDLLRRACTANIPGAIVTFVYAQGTDDDYVRESVDIITAGGASVLFVQLVCDVATLRERLTAESRKAFRKLSKVEVLDRLMREHNLLGPVPHQPNLTLDITDMRPDAAARQIAEHYRLSE